MSCAFCLFNSCSVLFQIPFLVPFEASCAATFIQEVLLLCFLEGWLNGLILEVSINVEISTCALQCHAHITQLVVDILKAFTKARSLSRAQVP